MCVFVCFACLAFVVCCFVVVCWSCGPIVFLQKTRCAICVWFVLVVWLLCWCWCLFVGCVVVVVYVMFNWCGLFWLFGCCCLLLLWFVACVFRVGLCVVVIVVMVSLCLCRLLLLRRLCVFGVRFWY